MRVNLGLLTNWFSHAAGCVTYVTEHFCNNRSFRRRKTLPFAVGRSPLPALLSGDQTASCSLPPSPSLPLSPLPLPPFLPLSLPRFLFLSLPFSLSPSLPSPTISLPLPLSLPLSPSLPSLLSLSLSPASPSLPLSLPLSPSPDLPLSLPPSPVQPSAARSKPDELRVCLVGRKHGIRLYSLGRSDDEGARGGVSPSLTMSSRLRAAKSHPDAVFDPCDGGFEAETMTYVRFFCSAVFG